jgi:hypothetical protein
VNTNVLILKNLAANILTWNADAVLAGIQTQTRNTVTIMTSVVANIIMTAILIDQNQDAGSDVAMNVNSVILIPIVITKLLSANTTPITVTRVML